MRSQHFSQRRPAAPTRLSLRTLPALARGIVMRIEAALYPELRAFPPAERGRALRAARETPFDFLETVGMVAMLALVTACTSHGATAPGLVERLSAGLLNFALAIPLLVLGLGPFMVRRARRGLARQLTPHSAGHGSRD